MSRSVPLATAFFMAATVGWSAPQMKVNAFANCPMASRSIVDLSMFSAPPSNAQLPKLPHQLRSFILRKSSILHCKFGNISGTQTQPPYPITNIAVTHSLQEQYTLRIFRSQTLLQNIYEGLGPSLP